MKHRFSILVLSAVAFLSGIPSCTLTPEQKAKVIDFTQGSLQLAVDAGVLKPGQSILIGTGVGLITTLASPSAKPKEVPLTALGLAEVVQDGTVKKGDTVVIREADALVVSPPIPLGQVVPTVALPPN